MGRESKRQQEEEELGSDCSAGSVGRWGGGAVEGRVL